jgi:lambda family phage tail tape measure protein
MLNAAYNAAVRPVTNQVGGVLAEGVSGLLTGLLPFANGAPFSQDRVMPFATGGIVSSATPFGMRGGVGVMGEAGPEAIMPLARGLDGKLGVRGASGGGQTIVVNVSTPDVQGFQRSQGQIAAQVSRALARGQRNR